MPTKPEITEAEITLSIVKLERDMVKSLAKAATFDRVGRWEDAESCMDEALVSLRKIGILESTCDGVIKEAECGLETLFVGEFKEDEFVIEEFTQKTFKAICQ